MRQKEDHKNQALLTAGIIFAIISLLHLSRLYFNFSIVIGGHAVPLWANVVGFVIGAVLSYWMFWTYKHK